MNLKKRKEGYEGGFGGRTRKGGISYFYYNFKK